MAEPTTVRASVLDRPGVATRVETLKLDESRNYVKRILVLADSYRQLYPSLG